VKYINRKKRKYTHIRSFTSIPGSKGEIKECRYRLHWLNKSYL